MVTVVNYKLVPVHSSFIVVYFTHLGSEPTATTGTCVVSANFLTRIVKIVV